MATATIPAAVPDPNDPPTSATGNAPSGLLASMLAPVDPARPATFNIPAPAAADDDSDAPVASASSAAYHGSNEAGSSAQNSGSTVDKKSVVRAWLLAGAARWGKGGGAHNKRLDMQKAKANARQVKENRQVSINHSGGLLSGKGSAGSGGSGNSGGGKGNSGASAKGPVKGPVKGPRNSNGDAHKGPSGRSGGHSGSGSGGAGGRGPGGGGSGGGSSSSGRGNTAPKTPKTDGGGRSQGPKPSKVDLGKGKDRGAGGSANGGKNGAPGAGGNTGSAGKSGGTNNGGSAKGSGPAPSTGKNNKSPDPKDSTGKGGTGTNSGKVDLSKGPGGKPGKGGPSQGVSGKNDGPGSPATRTPKPDKATKDHKGRGGKDAQPPAKTEPGKPASGKAFSTKESRETGYRDGTRAAKAAAHAKAYRDGIKDGWTDTTEAAERQKAQLDKAHEERKKAQQAARDKEQDVSGASSSADHHKPQPMQVKGIDAKTVWLGEGADRSSLSRSEVRSLKTFERRLRTKEAAMKKIAEHTKALKAHAEAQSNKVTALMESAKSVKGGAKLIAALAKTADHAKVQAGQAAQIHKRAARAADRCTAVLANAETRYGGMYKAVVDSDETAPAEMRFYQEGATSHG